MRHRQLILASFLLAMAVSRSDTDTGPYEYDPQFMFVKKHVIKSGHTHLGIQTAAFHDGQWWFGCYGGPKILLVTKADLKMEGRFEFDCSLGIVGIGNGTLLIGRGSCSQESGCVGRVGRVGRVVREKPHKKKGLAAR